jgi:LAO/AO transport system kinase
MADLARDPRAFIRPSPAQAELGGVARRTREAVALCEAAGFDVVIIETVGVGQSETLVAGMSDLFVLLMAPAGGDELQGVKRGIMEAADLILVNKADGELKPAASSTRADYAGALRLFRHREGDPEGIPAALTVSALTGDGIEAAWRRIRDLAAWRRESGHWERRRTAQRLDWFREEIRHLVLDRFAADPEAARRMRELSEAVSRGEVSPAAAAAHLVGQGDRPESP